MLGADEPHRGRPVGPAVEFQVRAHRQTDHMEDFGSDLPDHRREEHKTRDGPQDDTHLMMIP